MERRDFAKHTVLIADPSTYMSNLIGSLLRGLGLQDITEVNDSTSALLALERKTYDVVLIEESLTPIDGVKLTRQLRNTADAPNRLSAVIMTFTLAELRRIQEARDAGVSEFLRKPLSANILKSRIEAAIANPRPFVEADAYAGPDRRRRAAQVEGGERRKSSDAPEA